MARALSPPPPRPPAPGVHGLFWRNLLTALPAGPAPASTQCRVAGEWQYTINITDELIHTAA